MDRGTVLYVGNFELPDLGASANRVVSNGKLFRMLGYRTVFLGVKRNDTFSGIREICAEMYEESGPRTTVQWFRHMVSVGNIRKVIEKTGFPNIIILYNTPFSLLFRVKRVFPQAKVVYDCTEWSDTTDGSLMKRAVKKTDERFIRTKADKAADGLLVVSTTMLRAYQNNHILLLPPLVDVEDPVWRQTGKKEKDSFEFCFSGMLDGNKDSLDMIVRAFSRVDDCRAVLRVVGVDRQSFLKKYPHLESAVSALGDSLIFMGKVSHAETLRYIQNADCNLIIREADRRNTAGFPTKFVEAFTAGKPIIATDISDVKRYVNRESQVHLIAYAADPLREAMEKSILQSECGVGIRRDFHYASFAPACEAWLSNLIQQRLST